MKAPKSGGSRSIGLELPKLAAPKAPSCSVTPSKVLHLTDHDVVVGRFRQLVRGAVQSNQANACWGADNRRMSRWLSPESRSFELSMLDAGGKARQGLAVVRRVVFGNGTLDPCAGPSIG